MIAETVIGFLLLYISFKEYFDRKERKKLIEAVMAKSLRELKEGEAQEEAAKKPPAEWVKESEFIPVDQASDESFERAIKKQLNRETIKDLAKEKLKKIVGGKHG